MRDTVVPVIPATGRVPDGWSIVYDGPGADEATACADRFRARGRRAVVVSHYAQGLDLRRYWSHRTVVDVPADDASWATYHAETAE